jgi:epsilon-lactone hydrolase
MQVSGYPLLREDAMTPIDLMIHDVYALSPADKAAQPALLDMFRRAWSGPLAQASLRVAYDAYFAATPPLADVSLHPSTDPNVPGWVCKPADPVDDQVLLYIHGGAYVMGTAPAYRGFVSQIAARARRTTYILEYPLAPETALPGAINLAVGAVKSLRQRFAKVGIVGDSAGGGLTLAALAKTDTVSAAVVFSPWADLTFSGASMRERASRDVLISESALREAARGYIGDATADDPRASPLLDVPASLPPLLIQVGSEEVLYDDSVRYAKQAHALGHDVTLQEWTGMPHVFQQNVEQLEAARQALDLAAGFLDRRLSGTS